MIKLTKIHKSFKNRILFDSLNISFENHGLYILSGENGIGKTTLLYILGMFDFDYEGNYMIDDIDVTSLSIKEKRKYRNDFITYLASKGNLIGDLSVKDHLNINNKELKLPEYLGYINPKQKVSILSGGEEILLALFIEAYLNKKIYLLDEVTASLDDEHFIQVMDLIKKLSKSSLVIMASHDPRTLINHGINIYLGDLEKKS